MKITVNVFSSPSFQCRNDGSVPFALSTAMDSIIPNMDDVNQQVSSVKSAVKASTRKQRKPAARSTAKKAPKASRSLDDVGRNPLGEVTPAQSRRPPPNLGMTPFITPKFNTRTPMSRTVSRVARPDEMLVSLSGSPVVPLNLRSKVRICQYRYKLWGRKKS